MREGRDLLEHLADFWERYTGILVKWLRKCFQYLDQHHTKQFNVEKLTPKGVLLFKEHVFAPLKIAIIKAFLGEVEKQRKYQDVDLHVLKQVSDIILEMRGKDEEERKADFYSELEGAMKEASYEYFSE